MVNEHVTRLAEAVTEIVARGGTEQQVTAAVADVLTSALANGLYVPASYTRPDLDRYVMYPLYVDPDGRFSIASAVWNVGQKTPVHGHETWGVVGIYAGHEHEVRYDKPTQPDVPLTAVGEHTWGPGQVTVCCTTDDDVHSVDCSGQEPCVGIHVYGADIGTLERRSYVPNTGAVSWFVSRWAQPAA